MNENSKIRKLANESSVIYIGRRLPGGKDGFLAANSILAIIIFVARAYKNITNSDTFSLPEKFSSLRIQSFGNQEKAFAMESKIVLFSGYAMPVAIDLESKFSEAALGNIMLADYRNFAHGRHFWLSMRASSTMIISLVTPENKLLALKTLALIPDELATITIETPSTGVKGMIELLLSAFNFVNYTGKLQGIDPGRPNVPEYGKKMYHISYTPESLKLYKGNDLISIRAVLRKCQQTNSRLFDYYSLAFENFKSIITDAQFKEIVFDYDATLKEKRADTNVEKEIFEQINAILAANITVKIATGRGKSVRLELKRMIHPDYWDNVIIGYYNGGTIANLSNDYEPSRDICAHPSLQQLASEIDRMNLSIEYDLRPQQLSIMLDNYQVYLHRDIILETVRKHSALKAFSSGHSIDVIPAGNSKLNLLKNSTGDVLCIGDSGQYLGNDYELLSTKFSLSVNKVSYSSESCWNYAPNGINNTKATLYYLRQIHVDDHYFKITIE